MIKLCPKCGEEFESVSKWGDERKYCSRKCANSRVFSEESKLKKSIANKKHHGNTVVKKERYRKISEKKILKNSKKSFDELGIDGKRARIIREQKNVCNHCGISEWRGKPLSLELDHIDGDRTNNTRENLEAICPNCHSITETWRGRNKNFQPLVWEDHKDLILNMYSKKYSIRKMLIELGLAPKGSNYKRIKLYLNKFLNEQK